jgi:hypothetical protein
LSENTFYQLSFFLNNEDQELVKLVSDFETNEYELSPKWFEKHKIVTQGEKERLPFLAMSSIYAFKNYKIEKRIKEIQTELGNLSDDNFEKMTDLISEQMSLENVKKTLSLKLGRIILK